MATSEQIVVAAIFYFRKVLVFCRLIKRNQLEWFLLMISTQCLKNILWIDIQTDKVETIPHYVFN